MSLLRVIVVLSGFALSVQSVLNCAHDSHAPAYSEDAPSAFLPFSNGGFPSTDAVFDISVHTTYMPEKAHNIYDITMDTGSLGMAVSATSLSLGPSDFKTCTNGSEYLSSSGRLWEGYWINSNVTFTSERDQAVQATIPILAITQNSTCKGWNDATGTCVNKTNIVDYPTCLRYMGVGFARGSPQQPQALPDKNPFLNVQSVDGAPVKMHTEYIVTSKGVYVGLNATNTAKFQKTKLTRRGCSDDWNAVDMSISIDRLSPDNGTALFDTGISQSFICVGNDTYNQLNSRHALCEHPKTNTLCNETAVTVLVGDSTKPIANYSIVVGHDNPINATYYQVELPSKTEVPFINTGRHFYRGFETMFDAKCGWFGLSGQTTAMTIQAPNEQKQLLLEL